jgi:hypothetical protein
MSDEIGGSDTPSPSPSTDPNTLVQWVLRESYQQTTEDLRYYAEKVRSFNKQKKAIRDYLSAMRRLQSLVNASLHEQGIDSCQGARGDERAVAETIDRHATEFVAEDEVPNLCIPDRVPATTVGSLAAFEAEIRKWEEKLNTIGDDSQLANVDLQNILQKQQQTLQMMSNISKMLHDTAESVIRKMGG